MTTFSFPYHLVNTEYPNSGTRLQMGNSYEFAAAPTAPDQRTFTLTFPAMKYYVKADGTIDRTANADVNNMAALEDFYNSVKQYQPFTYPHPVYGNLQVRFKEPIKVPKGVPGGGGVLEALEILFVELP